MNDTTLSVTPETLPAIMWQNQPVITTELLAEIYGTVTDNIKMNFTRNASRFIEGVHYYLLKGADLKAFKSQVTKSYPALIHKFTTSFYLWTERGTVRHAKILDTDNAWAVQDRLEDFYFSKHQPKPYGLKELLPATPKTLTPAMLRHITKRVNWLVNNQTGTSFSALGGAILDEFSVNKRENIPLEKYAEVCAFLNCEPDAKALKGMLLEPVKVEYQVPAGMVLVKISELEALQALPIIPDGFVLISEARFFELKQMSIPLQLDDLKFFVEQSGGLVLMKHEVDKMKGVLKA